MMGKKILIVEDEALVGLAMQETLRQHGYIIPEIIDSGDDLIPGNHESAAGSHYHGHSY